MTTTTKHIFVYFALLFVVHFFGEVRLVVVCGFSTLSVLPTATVPAVVRTRRSSGPVPNRRPAAEVPVIQLGATSSSDLRENEESDEETLPKTERKATQSAPSKVVLPKDSVVSRLKQAATRAAAKALVAKEEAAAREIKERNSRSSNQKGDPRVSTRLRNLESRNTDSSGRPPAKALGTLTELTAMIDSQLSRSRQGLTNNVQNQQVQPPRDSMTAVMIHNDRTELLKPSLLVSSGMLAIPPHGGVVPPKQVAIILAKPLMDDQITIEYAARIQRLVRAMLYDNYRPNLICFVQGFGRSNTNSSGSVNTLQAAGAGGIVTDCDVGYIYFRHLAASVNLNMNDVAFHLERQSIQSGAFDAIATLIQKECVPRWMQDKIATVAQGTRRHVRKLPIQLMLVSSEYHLCILNDIHVRSPGQSPLRSFERWSSVSIGDGTTAIGADVPSSSSSTQSTIQLETSWTYLYATTANMRLASSIVRDNDDHLVATFAAACFKRSQDLIPVLQNLRGVVADKEFFQRDNYRVLVQARRALVSDMERLYQQQPSLAAVHRVLSPSPGANQKIFKNNVDEPPRLPLDVVLEGALLALGRCLDLVRPAGLLTGIVPPHDFRLAVNVLEQAVSQISVACDPDEPLPPTDWGPRPLLEENFVYGTNSVLDADTLD